MHSTQHMNLHVCTQNASNSNALTKNELAQNMLPMKFINDDIINCT